MMHLPFGSVIQSWESERRVVKSYETEFNDERTIVIREYKSLSSSTWNVWPSSTNETNPFFLYLFITSHPLSPFL